MTGVAYNPSHPEGETHACVETIMRPDLQNCKRMTGRPSRILPIFGVRAALFLLQIDRQALQYLIPRRPLGGRYRRIRSLVLHRPHRPRRT